jgi:hypothetical protein
MDIMIIFVVTSISFPCATATCPGLSVCQLLYWHAHTSLITYQCGGHHLFKPFRLGLVVEVHTAHEVISWKKTMGTMRLRYAPSCLMPMSTSSPISEVVVAIGKLGDGVKRRGEQRK